MTTSDYDPYAAANEMKSNALMNLFTKGQRTAKLDEMQQAAKAFFNKQVAAGQSAEDVYHNLERKLSQKQTTGHISSAEFTHLHDDLFQMFKVAHEAHEQHEMDALLEKTIDSRDMAALEGLMQVDEEEDEDSDS